MSETDVTDSPLNSPLDAAEARVLGCLVEKEATTPEAYPLTQNAALTASNQKTSRDPVMNLEPGKVGHALRSLESRGLVKGELGARASRYRHTLHQALDLTAPKRAIIALLLLRGPQTVSELLTRSERLHRFDDLDDVEHALERLAAREPAMVVKIPRAPGQREERWAERLSADGQRAPTQVSTPANHSHRDDLAQRVDELEARLAALEAQLGLEGE
jgi:hypothetical protein